MGEAINIKEQYYRMPEEEMQEFIRKAKKGDSAAQTRLLYEFRNFLSKYTTLLYHAKYDYRNYDMRKFIALYIADKPVGRRLSRGKATPIDMRHINKCLHDLQFMVVRYGDEEDVQQTIEMTFFQCLNKYERTRSKAKPDEWVPFSGYLYSYFYYLLKKNVDAFLIDQNARTTFPLISDDDMASDDQDGEIIAGYSAPPDLSAEEMLGPEEIDEYWVMGDSAMPPFDLLSVQDRQLIKWRFVDGRRSSEIAQRITEHPNTVRERFSRIRTRVAEIMAEDLTD
jgi:hypothetical protein